ncbi:MAG: EF-hand domain-containing protein [Pseudomonadota bacterium]
MTHVRSLAALALGAALAAGPALAGDPLHGATAAQSVDAGRSQVEDFARALDADGDMSISAEELRTATMEIFPSADTDGSGAVDRAEFVGWKYGLADMAAFRGRDQGFDAAMGVVFDLFDRNDDGGLDPAEMEEGMMRSLAYADTDGDGAMALEEFYRDFLITVALRNGMVEG